MLATAGFNLEFVDLSGDGRLDIVTLDMPPLLGQRLVWLEQPAEPGMPWRIHLLGSYAPDSIVGVAVADIDSDGDPDVMTGGYSRGSRTTDGEADIDDPLGRLAWWENPGEMGADWTTTRLLAPGAGHVRQVHPRSTWTAMATSTSSELAATAVPTTASSGSSRSAQRRSAQGVRAGARTGKPGAAATVGRLIGKLDSARCGGLTRKVTSAAIYQQAGGAVIGEREGLCLIVDPPQRAGPT